MPYIGIDFGTSNSVVADFQFGRAVVLPNHEGQAATPSVVTLRKDGSLAFGQEAKENFDQNRSIRSIKRVLGSAERIPLVGQDLRPEQVAVMLFSLLKRALIGAWHHISREHLPRYANEFAFRWNTRHDSEGRRLERIARWIEGKRLTYRQVSHPLCVC